MTKLKTMMLAAATAAVALAAMPAEARPHHRHKMCTMKRVHGHLVRRCYYR